MLKKILIGASVTIGTTLIIAATGWNFLAVANMSDKFVQKLDFNLAFKTFSECNEKDHDRIKSKLDKIYDLLLEHYRGTSLSARGGLPTYGISNSDDVEEENTEYNFTE